MLKTLALAACSVLFASSLLAAENPKVLLTTSLGEIEIELDAEKAPISVENFLGYVDSGYYAGTQFHRVIPGFMVQGGGFDADMQQKQTGAPIKNEADNGLHNVRGTLAMARTQVRDSATSQFFINVRANHRLDFGISGAGYAVFGEVVQGIEIADRVSLTPTTTRGQHENAPQTWVVIRHARELEKWTPPEPTPAPPAVPPNP